MVQRVATVQRVAQVTKEPDAQVGHGAHCGQRLQADVTRPAVEKADTSAVRCAATVASMLPHLGALGCVGTLTSISVLYEQAFTDGAMGSGEVGGLARWRHHPRGIGRRCLESGPSS